MQCLLLSDILADFQRVHFALSIVYIILHHFILQKGKKVSKRQKITSLNKRQEQQILAMHNTYRRRIPGPAADMEEMVRLNGGFEN